MGLDEVAVPQEIDLVNDMDQDWIDDRSEPEVEFEPEVEQTHEEELTNLRVLERRTNNDLPAESKETILRIQDVDKDGIKYVSHDKPSPTGSLQMVLCAFRNPTSICSTLRDRRGRRWIFLSDWG